MTDPAHFFEELGYRVSVHQDDDDVWWTDLIPAANPESVIRRYGRGATEPDSALRAMERWRVEQIGSG